MKPSKLNNITRIHFIGIGGIGMSALARLFMHEEKEVSGSDSTTSAITRALSQEGATIYDSQVASNISPRIELVIYTEAMSKDQEEMVAAEELGVPMMNYFEALGLVANEYYLIAVSGTHGKTTTTAMLTDILEAADFDPTAIIGSLRAKTGSNFRAGKSKYAVVEACEYKRDFLSLKPDILVITNIEAEHLDYYEDLKDVERAFHELAKQVKEGGAIVANLQDENIGPVLKGVERETIDYETFINPPLTLKQPGEHNRMNAAAAMATASFLGVDEKISKTALEKFAGTWRRFEYKGNLNGANVYDDYGHHPTEITATLHGVREKFPDKKITLIYQPHLGSRTEKLFDNFVTSLSKADGVILAPIYRARLERSSDISSEQLAEAILKVNPNTQYIETFKEIVDRVKSMVTKNDLVLIMGAGNITEVANTLVDI